MKRNQILVPALALLATLATAGVGHAKERVLARIDGAAFTEGDLTLRLSTLDDQRREEVLRDPELRRAEFNNILRNRLHALSALKSSQGRSASLRRRLAMVDQRVMTQYYFETHMGIHGGFTRAEVEAFHAAHQGLFTDDSGKVLPLSRVYARVVDTVIIRDAMRRGVIDSFHQTSSHLFVARPSAEISIIRTDTRRKADEAFKALRGGASFGDVAAKFSSDASKADRGKVAAVRPGDYRPELGSHTVLDSLLFAEKTRLAVGKYSDVMTRDGGFLILKVDAFTPERNPPFAEVADRVFTQYLMNRKTPNAEREIAQLKEKYKVSFGSHEKTPSEKELRAYYDAHRADYESPETFELYHIEADDRDKLTAAIGSIGDLAAFKALAEKTSGNALTRARQGHLGTVKRDFALPYGVGMLPALFPALDEIEDGKLDEVIENPATGKWHAFWLEKKAPGAPKPFERVRALVIEDVKANAVKTVTPTDTLAVIDGLGKAIREDDVLFVRQEIPAHVQDRYTRENLVDYLVVWEVVSAEARARGLDKEAKLRAARLQNEDNFWGGVYRDSLLPKSWEESPALLEKTFKANKALFTTDSGARDWKPHARDVAAWLRLTGSDLDLEYHTNPERYMRDSALIPFPEARASIFANLKPVAHARLDNAVLEKLKARYKVKIEDASLREPSLEPVAETYKKAQDLHYERKLDQATALYEKLRTAFPKRAGLQDSISFGLAQIYIEQERYVMALAEYRRVNYLYPSSPNDYKAMFMVGFIQAEHLRQDSAAVRSFEAMLKKHPQSDLSDDAEWMIRNIRSGGALMPALKEEDGEFEDAEPAEPAND